MGERRVFSAGLVALVVVGAGALAPAAGANIVVGSDLSLQPMHTLDNCVIATPPCTNVFVEAHDGNKYAAVSPTDGTVVSFGYRSFTADTVTFRILDLSGDRAEGAGTAPEQEFMAGGTYNVHVPHMAIKAGEAVGFDSSSTTAEAKNCGAGGLSLVYHPVLLDGGGFKDPDANGTCELLVNAVVRPSDEFALAHVQPNPKDGTAKLRFKLPGPGRLSLSGNGVKKTSAKVKGKGKTTVKLSPAGGVKHDLQQHGHAMVKVAANFAPHGGHAKTRNTTVKLVED